MKSFSIVIVYNKASVYEGLVKNLEKQSVIDDLEIIGIDNTKNQYSSCATALNYGAGVAGGEILLFAHQDLFFTSADAIEKFTKVILQNKEKLVGVAGYRIGVREKFSTIVHGDNKQSVGQWQGKEIEEVENFDECFFGMTKDMWQRYKFDEEICDNWHLYAVELCLRARLGGVSCVVAPIALGHKSSGNMNKSFYLGVKKIIAKYKKSYKYLFTTCVQIRNTNFGLMRFRQKQRIIRLLYRVCRR